ncbi:MAG: glycosyltransferase family 39 protein [Chloroflexi bacterium OHK40]
MRTSSTTGSLGEARPAARQAARPWALPRVSGTTLYLGALLLIGLALRLWFIAVNDIDPRYSAADDGDYYQRALRLAATGEYVDNSWLIRPPGHVLLFAGLLRVAMLLGDPTLGIAMIRGIQVALSLLLIPIGYDMARRLFNPTAGLIFAALLAVWFPLVELPALILSEPLFFFMLVLHCWLLVRWRDSGAGGPRRPLWLVAAGVSLAVAALARSPALYASIFTLAFVLWETRADGPAPEAPPSDRRHEQHRVWPAALQPWARRFLVAALAFLLPFATVIAPWTIRNYVAYQRLILIDTLGPVNLWMAMSDAVNEGRGEGEAKAILAGIPQEERQDFVSEDIRRILREEPWRLVRNFWPHFIHIWKAQWVEDYFVKVSFFTRPLRELWPLGALGDALWLVFTTASLFTLASRPREGGMRLLALGWIAYSCLTVMLIHVEPRYLLPIWLFMGLYGAAALAAAWGWLARRRADPIAARAEALAYARSPWGLAGIALCAAFLVLVFTYRDYPRILAAGVQRELHRNAGDRAYAAGDYEGAIAAYTAMIAVDPDFVDGRTDLARVYLELGRYDEGWAAVGQRQTHRSDVIRGALARGQGAFDRAIFYFEDAEVRAGEDVQKLAMEWLRPDPTASLQLGNGLDFGYLDGFSFGEDLPAEPGSAPRSYRWLQGRGVIALPLPAPLREGAVLRLRVAGGLPGTTPLTVTIGDVSTTIPVRGGEWRTYRVAVPPALSGQTRLEVRLRAPTFIPVQTNPASGDARLLSVMISSIAVD